PVGARIILTARTTSAGNYAVALRYANSTGSAKTISLYVNGLRSQQIGAPAGSGWLTVRPPVALRSGLNLLGYQYDNGDSGDISIDNVTVTDGVPLAARGAT